MPLACGENLHTVYRFREFLAADAVDIVQPNIVRVGGMTPFLRIAELARTANRTLAPHLLPDLSAQLAFTPAGGGLGRGGRGRGLERSVSSSGPTPVLRAGAELELAGDVRGLGLDFI